MRTLLSVLVAPPAGPLLLAAIGWWLARRTRVLGAALVALGLGLLVLSTLPVVGSALLLTLESRHAPLDLQVLGRRVRSGDARAPQAVVVIGGGARRNAREVPLNETVNAATLERLAHGARVARATGLPLLVSGGVGADSEYRPEAELMAEALREAFGLRVRWTEPRALSTEGNARESARLLSEAGVQRIVLVTHAYHMPRAEAAFRATGLEVSPAPTAFGGGWVLDELGGWIPQAGALQATRLVVHEWAGMLWYRLAGAIR